MAASFGVLVMRGWLAAILAWMSAVAIAGGVLVLAYFLFVAWLVQAGFPYLHAGGCCAWLLGWSWVAMSVLFLNPEGDSCQMHRRHVPLRNAHKELQAVPFHRPGV